MIPTRTEIVMRLLDDVLSEPLTLRKDKLHNLRQIERAAKRMADGVERRIAEERAEPIQAAPVRRE